MAKVFAAKDSVDIYFLTIVPELDKCLKFMAFRGFFCIEYSHVYPLEQTLILYIYPGVALYVLFDNDLFY